MDHAGYDGPGGHDAPGYEGYEGYDDYDDYDGDAYFGDHAGYGEDPHPAAVALERDGRAGRPGQPGRSGGSRPPRGGGRSARRRRRFFGWVAALSVIVGLAAAIWFGSQELLGFAYDDYKGAGVADVVIEVSDGDTTTAIATTLEEADVVASDQAFLSAAQGNPEIRSIQPGFYVVRKKSSGANALNALLEDKARVGELQLTSGTQLHDTTLPGGGRVPGVLRKLSMSSCATLNGESTCVSPDRLQEVAAKTDLSELGVPGWLAREASKAPADRRLEGLIAPGVYDVKPGWSARQLLKEMLTASVAQYEAAGLPAAAKQTGRSPYEILVIGSVIEKEGVTSDFAKISRVIYNRLAKDMRLEMDSTINYVLDQPNIRTSSQDRANRGPYNTYQRKGLPPTPISSPSPGALHAALRPASGPWLYFVKCEKNGLSCFAASYDQHNRNIADAKRRGVW